MQSPPHENYFLNANLCDDFIFFVQISVVVVFGFVDGDMDGDLVTGPISSNFWNTLLNTLSLLFLIAKTKVSPYSPA